MGFVPVIPALRIQGHLGLHCEILSQKKNKQTEQNKAKQYSQAQATELDSVDLRVAQQVSAFVISVLNESDAGVFRETLSWEA
jgi:hypothetical protein